MNNLKIIAFSLILLILTVSVVSAVNPDDFKCPDGYEKIGTASYNGYEFRNGDNQNLDIYDWDGLTNIWFGNYDSHSCWHYDNNIYAYTDAGFCGYEELVEHDGKTYLIVSFIRTSSVGSDIPDSLYENLLEFNELNNLEPVSI